MGSQEERHEIPSQCPYCERSVRQLYDSSDHRTVYCGQCDEVLGVVSGDEPFELPDEATLAGVADTRSKEDICGGFSPDDSPPDYEFQPGDPVPGFLMPFQHGAELSFRNRTLIWEHGEEWNHYHIWPPDEDADSILGGRKDIESPILKWAHTAMVHAENFHDLEGP